MTPKSQRHLTLQSMYTLWLVSLLGTHRDNDGVTDVHTDAAQQDKLL